MLEKRQDQAIAIRRAASHFRKHARGKMVLPCGLGKTLIAFWIMRTLKAKTTLFMCPSIALIKQGLDEWKRQANEEGLNIKFLCVCSDNQAGKHQEEELDMDTSDLDCPVTTDPKVLRAWLKANESAYRVVFSTYQSSDNTAKAFRGTNIDFAVFDEAHRTAGTSGRMFSLLLKDSKITIAKRLFMTATERICDGDEVVSMDNESVYGKLFHSMSFKSAIDAVKKAVKRFKIKSGISYHSTIKRAERFAELIQMNVGVAKLNSFHVSGDMSQKERGKRLEKFASSRRAIVTNAKCLQEGVNIKSVDFVTFVDPIASPSLVVQACGRAVRLYDGKKMSYIILPVLVDEQGSLEANQESFRVAIETITALAASDERIVMQSIAREAACRSDRIVIHDIEEYHGVNMSLGDLAASIRIKITSRVTKLVPPPTKAELIAWCEDNGITSSCKFVEAANKPQHFGNAPWLKLGLKVSDIFGRSRTVKKHFASKHECIQWCIEHEVNSKEKYVQAKIPEHFPAKPWDYYQGIGCRAFFAPARQVYSIDETIEWCRKNRVFTRSQYSSARKINSRILQRNTGA